MLRARSLLKRAVLGRSMSAATVPGVTPLIEHDPEMHNLLEQEAERQRGGLELIGTLACVSHPSLSYPQRIAAPAATHVHGQY